jgi:hypothetical protein
MSKWLPFVLLILTLNIALYLLIPRIPRLAPVTESIAVIETLTESQQQAREAYKLGRHFIIGYTDFDEIKDLVKNSSIGGIFLTEKNVQGKTGDQIRQDIKDIQDIQASNKLPRSTSQPIKRRAGANARLLLPSSLLTHRPISLPGDS